MFLVCANIKREILVKINFGEIEEKLQSDTWNWIQT